MQVADNTVTTFYAASIDGGHDRSPCSEEPATYVEDSIAPHTRITSGPGARTRHRNVVFRFGDIAEETGTRFYCRLDKRRWTYCNTPLRLRHLRSSPPRPRSRVRRRGGQPREEAGGAALQGHRGGPAARRAWCGPRAELRKTVVPGRGGERRRVRRVVG